MPSQGAIANRRFVLLLMVAITFVSIISWGFSTPRTIDSTFSSTPIHKVSFSDDTLKGDAIMGKIGNETVKAELGRAAWRLLHTTMAKFPDKPTQDEQTALFSYIHLFARLYPWYDSLTTSCPLFKQLLTSSQRRMRWPLPPNPE